MEYKNKQKSFSILVILVIILTLSILHALGPINNVNAQGNTGQKYTLLEPLPCLGGTGSGCTKGTPITQMNLSDFFQYAFNLLIGLAAVSAVFMMVWGGFLYMTSDAWNKKNEGLEKFKNAIYGLLMVLSAFLILRTVNPKLVEIPKSITPIKLLGGTAQSPSALFDRLNASASGFQGNIDTAQAARQQAQANVTTLSAQLDTLNSQYQKALNSADETAITNIGLQIADIEGQIRDQQATAVTETMRAFMAGTLQDRSVNGSAVVSDSYVNDMETAILEQYSNGMAELQQIQNPPDPIQQQRLEDMKVYALTIVEIEKGGLQFNKETNGAWAKISEAYSAIGGRITGGTIGSAIGLLGSNLTSLVGSMVGGAYGEQSEIQKSQRATQTVAFKKMGASVVEDINNATRNISDPVLKEQLNAIKETYINAGKQL